MTCPAENSAADGEAMVPRHTLTVRETSPPNLTDTSLASLIARVDPEFLKELPELIMANIEEVPGWADSALLVTAHCHAYVLRQDLPALLKALQAQPNREDDGEVGK